MLESTGEMRRIYTAFFTELRFVPSLFIETKLGKGEIEGHGI
jgi:hypothetical protein